MDNRPSWDEYFLEIAYLVSKRSSDRFIKHGSVIVDNKTRHIIGTGYNGTVRGFDESLIDMYKRDERRPYMIHSEENALYNCTKNLMELQDGSTIYVTGTPCVNCLQRIINAGVTSIVHYDRIGSITEDELSAKMRNIILKSFPSLEIRNLKL